MIVRFGGIDPVRAGSTWVVAATSNPWGAERVLGRLHVGGLTELEYEMTHWDPDESDWSPNRLDAIVWAVTWLADLGRDPKIWFA